MNLIDGIIGFFVGVAVTLFVLAVASFFQDNQI
jgi:hypothetical protein